MKKDAMNKYLLIKHYEDNTIGVATNYKTNSFEMLFPNGVYDTKDPCAVEIWNFLLDTLRHFDNLLISLNMIDVNVKQVVRYDSKELVVLFE